MASFSKPTNNFTPPKWEGHWEAFSKTRNYIQTGTLDITKIKGKEYSWKLNVKSDFQMFANDAACPQMEYEGTATYNGANGLNSNTAGIGFVYYPESGFINIFHDYTDKTLTDQSLCFDPGDFKRIKK